MDIARLTHKIEYLCAFAYKLAELSMCKRLRVAAIVFPIDCSRIYAIGYNGPPAGMPNDSCANAEGQCGCVHAEANAIMKTNLDVAKPAILYSTASPCLNCAGLIVNSGIIRMVLYGHKYRSSTGEDRLFHANIGVKPLQMFHQADIDWMLR